MHEAVERVGLCRAVHFAVFVVCHVKGSCRQCFRVNTAFLNRCHHVNRVHWVCSQEIDGIVWPDGDFGVHKLGQSLSNSTANLNPIRDGAADSFGFGKARNMTFNWLTCWINCVLVPASSLP